MTGQPQPPPPSNADSAVFRIIGVSLALASAACIGASFILKKKGLLDSNAIDGRRPGTGHGYLKNTLWWTGMIMMLVGELCNVAAYAFQPAIIVTPLGSISVVISAIMSDMFLKERLSFAGKIGCAQCVLGATLLVVNSPPGSVTSNLAGFWIKVWDWGFMSYLIINVCALTYLILHAAPKWGEASPIVYIAICSLLGSFVVVVLQVIGSAIVYSVENPGDSQFKDWTLYLLIVFVCSCGVTQINYLNKALNIFSTAIVTPIYFVCFTTATLVCSALLFRDFAFPSAIQLVSAIVGFLVIPKANAEQQKQRRW
ncbi:magnesium transporter [Chytriomyces sp. MP71]|nr:magnesium transporter [Chytriomyces sp. MP71]